jgi:hypothetical protein
VNTGISLNHVACTADLLMFQMHVLVLKVLFVSSCECVCKKQGILSGRWQSCILFVNVIGCSGGLKRKRLECLHFTGGSGGAGFGSGYGGSYGGGAMKSSGGYSQRGSGPYGGKQVTKYYVQCESDWICIYLVKSLK